jgi:heptosyltransferase-3
VAQSRQSFEPAARPANDARLLVIIVARIGDTLLVTPMLRALKQACPRGTLTVLAHPKRAEVLEHLPFIDRLGTIEPKTAWPRGWLGGVRFDLAFVFGRDLPLLRYALRVSRRAIAFEDESLAREDARLTLVPRPSAPLHAVEERALLARAAGIEMNSPRLAFAVTGAERDWAKDWLAKHAPTAKPRIGLQMLSFPTKAHRNWPPESFAELCARILARHPETVFVVFGDADAARNGEDLSRRFPGKISIVAGALRLRESAALIGALDLYIGVDTGPTHIAGALEVPMIGIYHHAYPGRNLAPLARGACRVLEQPATGELRVDQVMSEVESLLAARVATEVAR